MFVKFNLGFTGWGMVPYSHHECPEFGTVTDCQARVKWRIGVGWNQLYRYGSIPNGLFIVRDVRGGLDPQMYSTKDAHMAHDHILDVIRNASEVPLWIITSCRGMEYYLIQGYSQLWRYTPSTQSRCFSQHFPATRWLMFTQYDGLPTAMIAGNPAPLQHGKWHDVATKKIGGSHVTTIPVINALSTNLALCWLVIGSLT